MQVSTTSIGLTEAERVAPSRGRSKCVLGGREAPIGQMSWLCGMVEREQRHARRRFFAERARPRDVAVITPRARDRERRPARTRRTASSSTTSGSDPGDSEPPRLRHVSEVLADELARIADRLRARGGIG